MLFLGKNLESIISYISANLYLQIILFLCKIRTNLVRKKTWNNYSCKIILRSGLQL